MLFSRARSSVVERSPRFARGRSLFHANSCSARFCRFTPGTAKVCLEGQSISRVAATHPKCVSQTLGGCLPGILATAANFARQRAPRRVAILGPKTRSGSIRSSLGIGRASKSPRRHSSNLSIIMLQRGWRSFVVQLVRALQKFELQCRESTAERSGTASLPSQRCQKRIAFRDGEMPC